MKLWQKNLLLDVAPLLLGAMLTLSFAPFEIFPFAILAPAGLLMLWLNVSAKRAFWRGFIFGLGLFGTGVSWVFISIHTFGHVPPPLAIVITFSFVSLLAVFPGLVGYYLNYYFPTSSSAKIVYAFPVIWVFAEWLRSWIFTGFPWLFLGSSQTNSPLSGYAPLLSVYGVSLAVLLSSSVLVEGFIQLKNKAYKSFYFCCLTLVLIWLVGGLAHLISWTEPEGKPFSVSLVQGNIPQQIKWSPEHLYVSLDGYEKLTEPLWGKSQLIIWPEGAIPLPLEEAQAFFFSLVQKSQETHTNLMIGIPTYSQDRTGYYNAIISIGNQPADKYVKRRLVPFGEYIPFPQFLSRFFSILDIPMSDMISGDRVTHPLIVDGVQILPFICYEIAFPELVNTRNEKIGVILTVTNDAWFGQSIAQAQHLQMARMRSIELRRPGLFVSNDGITAIITPEGHIQAAAPPYQSYVLTGAVQPTAGLTPWQRFGMDPVLVIMIGMLIRAFYLRYKLRLPKITPNHTITPAEREI